MNEPFDYVEVKIPAKPEFVGVIRLTLSGIASRMRFAYEEIEDLKIAISEACTNAVQHAYKQNEQGEVVIGFGLYSDRLEVMVADNGKSFDFQSARQGIGPYDQTDSVEFLREGGLGLYLIETLMDEVRIHHKEGVTVFMTKYLEGEQVERDAKTIST
ncbi:anti-sigma B factor RsbW [Cytobacillus sp. NCCP-133]|uniref:anti-sigma B factor RsbW n=1 Tax=Cytobacillus sp. NCCP-133 TaxID=766848 RepID=UPI0022316EAE|nr:anti-sigma B factor RsbW [Cytobacillus sp. NCCP-133]GLB60995.1 serine-protein kinase RsbW [Cytobacillus sp. NCCP-133]